MCQAALTPRLEQVLWGIKKEQAVTHQVRLRLPITTEIMHQIYGVLSRSPNEYQPIMLLAACCTAFFEFLRVGKMTVPNQESFDDSVHLSLRDISVDSRSNPTTIWLTIKQSKTDPFHTDSIACPVKALLPYLAVWGNSSGPLFTFSDHTYLTRSQFKMPLLATLKLAGLDDSKYNAPIGAKAEGISDVHIQIVGRWQSSAYQSYIRTPTPVLRKLSKQLVSSSQSVSAWYFVDHQNSTCNRHKGD